MVRNRRRGVQRPELIDYIMKFEDNSNVYIEVYEVDEDGGYCILNMTNLIILYLFERYNWKEFFQICFVKSKFPNDIPILKYKLSTPNIKYQITNPSSLPKLVSACDLPSVYFETKKFVISGLTSLARFLLKYSYLKFNEGNIHRELASEMKSLLGFKEGCLAACAEASTLTSFCEIEMTELKVLNGSDMKIPAALYRFEHHLSQPVRIHNFRKVIQSRNRNIIKSTGSDFSNQNLIPETIDQLSHDYAESTNVTLSDVVVFPFVKLSYDVLGSHLFETHLPKVSTWYSRMQNFTQNFPLSLEIAWNKVIKPEDSLEEDVTVTEEDILISSLYNNARSKCKSNEYTKQENVEEAVEFLKSRGISPEFSSVSEPFEPIDWNSYPEGGDLPASRKERKCDQLENLIQMLRFVIQTKKEKEQVQKGPTTIVDFCSGGGHLGILVAWLIPNVNVILIENKEESVRRAQIRVEKIGLENISVIQCNLTSFHGQFDIGIALHACGSSTDLVLEKCKDTNASFVISPCCYGSIRNNHLIQYPRSNLYKNTRLSYNQYLTLAHSSDQTHDEKNPKTTQGKMSMVFVDSDRLEYFNEQQYSVQLKRMMPETASPKNHILVGINFTNNFS